MSDDSWAFVEPPEEAFDPGPGWDSVPQDPAERRPADGGPGARHGSTRATAHPAPPQDRTVPEQRSVQRPGDASQHRGTAGSAAVGRAPAPAATGQPAPRSSRSVVWSPDTDAAGTSPTDAMGLNAPTQPSGPGAGPDAWPRAGSHAAVRPDQDEHAGPTGPRGIPHFIDSSPGAAAAPGASPRDHIDPGQDDPAIGAPTDAPARPRSTTGPGTTGPDSARSSSSGPTATVAAPPADAPGISVPEAGVSGEEARRKPVSRYQQLLDEAERKRAEEAAAARGVVDLRFVEDEPSADDETLEDSGLVGRTAIERILNGRLIEERGINGQ